MSSEWLSGNNIKSSSGVSKLLQVKTEFQHWIEKERRTETVKNIEKEKNIENREEDSRH